MSMHLEKPYLTTTNYRTKAKKQSARMVAARNEHERWLESRGLSTKQIKAKMPVDKKGRRLGVYSIPDLSDGIDKSIVLSNSVGNGFKKHQNQYTGTEIIGIATMHKSNAVPVLRGTNQAKEISAMRR